MKDRGGVSLALKSIVDKAFNLELQADQLTVREDIESD